MKSKKFILITMLLAVFTLSGCTVNVNINKDDANETGEVSVSEPIQTNLETYSSNDYSFTYPSDYTITLPSQSFPALTVKKANNMKLELFQISDFPGGDRPVGFTGTETQEEVDGYASKELLTVGTGNRKYDVFLYYSESDSQTQDELKRIFESISIKK